MIAGCLALFVAWPVGIGDYDIGPFQFTKRVFLRCRCYFAQSNPCRLDEVNGGWRA